MFSIELLDKRLLERTAERQLMARLCGSFDALSSTNQKGLMRPSAHMFHTILDMLFKILARLRFEAS